MEGGKKIKEVWDMIDQLTMISREPAMTDDDLINLLALRTREPLEPSML